MEATRCDRCKHYAKLEEPYHYDAHGYPEGVTVYGFCGKSAKATFAFYPIYIPDGGVCKDFSRKKGVKRGVPNQEGQLVLEGMP